MWKLSFLQRARKWLAVAALLTVAGTGIAMAQAEPTIKQIYDTAQTGKVAEAQTMVQQVLIAHPNSAKAYFVQAELFARQGDASRGREALVKADKLAPGLPFAKPETVQALRTQLSSKSGAGASRESAGRASALSSGAAPLSVPQPSSFPVGLGLALGGAAIALVIFLMRRKPAANDAPGAYGNPSAPNGSMASGGLSGPQTFGMGNANAAPGYGQPVYGQPSNGQPGYPQPGYAQPPAGSGLGGRVMGGLATGLAVGAGVMAAQAIGKTLTGNNEHAPNNFNDNAGSGGGNGFAPLPGNSDLGGQNFGLNDSSSWDDGGAGGDAGGGGDWDN